MGFDLTEEHKKVLLDWEWRELDQELDAINQDDDAENRMRLFRDYLLGRSNNMEGNLLQFCWIWSTILRLEDNHTLRNITFTKLMQVSPVPSEMIPVVFSVDRKTRVVTVEYYTKAIERLKGPYNGPFREWVDAWRRSLDAPHSSSLGAEKEKETEHDRSPAVSRRPSRATHSTLSNLVDIRGHFPLFRNHDDLPPAVIGAVITYNRAANRHNDGGVDNTDIRAELTELLNAVANSLLDVAFKSADEVSSHEYAASLGEAVAHVRRQLAVPLDKGKSLTHAKDDRAGTLPHADDGESIEAPGKGGDLGPIALTVVFGGGRTPELTYDSLEDLEHHLRDLDVSEIATKDGSGLDRLLLRFAEEGASTGPVQAAGSYLSWQWEYDSERYTAQVSLDERALTNWNKSVLGTVRNGGDACSYFVAGTCVVFFGQFQDLPPELRLLRMAHSAQETGTLSAPSRTGAGSVTREHHFGSHRDIFRVTHAPGEKDDFDLVKVAVEQRYPHYRVRRGAATQIGETRGAVDSDGIRPDPTAELSPNENGRILVILDTVTVRTGMSLSEFLTTFKDFGGPDLSRQVDELRRLREQGQDSPKLDLLDSIAFGIFKQEEDAMGTGLIFQLAGALHPGDESVTQVNRERLDSLKKSGDSLAYAQFNDIVILDPGQPDIWFALIRWACHLNHGVAKDRTCGTITRGTHLLRSALKVEAITADYRDDFRSALRGITGPRVVFTN